jgi:hypothetical protein
MPAAQIPARTLITMSGSLLGQIQALSRTLVHDAHQHQMGRVHEGPSAPLPMPTLPSESSVAAAAAATTSTASSASSSSHLAGQLGDRLFLETEKLQLFTRVLQAIHDAAPANEPRSLVFAPSGMYLTVAVPRERRCHALSLPDFFFAKYRCSGRGFRMVVDLQTFIGALTKIYSTHRGRCVQLIDQPNNTLLIRSRADPQPMAPTATMIKTETDEKRRQTSAKPTTKTTTTTTKAIRPSPSVVATDFKAGHVEMGNDGRMWRVSVTKAGVYRWAPVHGTTATTTTSSVTASSLKKTTAEEGAKRKREVVPTTASTTTTTTTNSINATRCRDEKMDDNKFFETVLIPIDPNSLSSSSSSAGGVPRCERIPDRAYTRYPHVIEVGSEWMHNIFKRLQQHTKMGLEFDGEKRLLQFTSTLDGAPCREGDIISSNHILPNPFLPTAPNVSDTRTVVATRDVAVPAQDRPPAADLLPALAAGDLSRFRYRADFAPAHIWKMVKPSKLCAHLHIYLAPDQPLLLQFLLQRDKDDSRRAATYSTWIAPIGRQPNPHVRMPSGGVAAVTQKMLEIAPQLGSADQTFRVCAEAIQMTGGTAAPLDAPLQLAPSLAPASTSVPTLTSSSSASDDDQEEEDENENDNEEAANEEEEEEEEDITNKPAKRQKTSATPLKM